MSEAAERLRRVRKELRSLKRRLPDVAPESGWDEDGNWLIEEAEDTIADMESTAALIRAWLATS